MRKTQEGAITIPYDSEVTDIFRNKDITTADDKDGFSWYENVGMRAIDILQSDIYASLISPDRPFKDHLGSFLTYLKKCGAKDTNSTRLRLSLYLMRMGFPKMMTRAAEHCRMLRVEDEDGDGPASLAESAASTALPPKAYDYGEKLIPGASENCDFHILETARPWKGIHESIMRVLQKNILPLGQWFSSKDTLIEMEPTEAVRDVIEFTSIELATVDAPKTFGDLHAIFGSLVLAFFSGLKTISKIYKDQNLRESWEDFADTKAGQLADDLYRWLKIVSVSASSISVMCRGKGDSYFRMYLSKVFPTVQHVDGCIAWLQMCTDQIGSSISLLKPAIQSRLQKARITLLDVTFRENTSEAEMMSLEEFFAELKSDRLSDVDRAELLEDIKRSQGVHKGIDSFGGTMHAETLLIILVLMYRRGEKKPLRNSIRNLAKIVSLRSLGVSKKCCPVCTAIVEIAEKELGIDISHAGSHGIYSACMLPPFTPKALARKIITKVEADILKKLIIPRAIVLRAALSKRRVSSSSKDDPERRFIGSIANREVDNDRGDWSD